MSHKFTSKEVLTIVDSCFSKFASDFNKDASTHANKLLADMILERNHERQLELERELNDLKKSHLISTGQIDKNWWLIYEGDVIRYENVDYLLTLENFSQLDTTRKKWQIQRLSDKSIEVLYNVKDDLEWNNYEVIGNVYLEGELKEKYNL